MSVAKRWFTSSHGSPDGGDGVEAATRPHAVHVRDSEDPGPTLTPATGFADRAAGRA